MSAIDFYVTVDKVSAINDVTCYVFRADPVSERLLAAVVEVPVILMCSVVVGTAEHDGVKDEHRRNRRNSSSGHFFGLTVLWLMIPLSGVVGFVYTGLTVVARLFVSEQWLFATKRKLETSLLCRAKASFLRLLIRCFCACPTICMLFVLCSL